MSDSFVKGYLESGGSGGPALGQKLWQGPTLLGLGSIPSPEDSGLSHTSSSSSLSE